MFGNRRRRAASNPHLNGSNASASATTAAAQAFLKSAASNASLSSAAAAAALRSRPTTPTSVADVQTKRTLRRAGSTSSVGSSVAGSSRGPPGSQLERRGSSGSMTERTFRDPSPARAPPVPSAPDAPPVPAIPKNMQQTQPPIPQKSHRRAASLEAPPMRLASPPPNKASGRGSSLGPSGTTQSPRRTGPRAPSLSSVQELTGVDRPASRGSVNSINFSLPTGSRPPSPIAHRRLTSSAPQRQNPARIVSPTNQNLIYDPNTRSFLPEAQILAIEQKLNDAANKPVKKKKRGVSAAGSHLSGGTVGGRLRGTAIDEMEAAASSSAPRPVHQPVAAPEPAPITQAAPPPAPEPPKTTTPPRRRKKKVVLSDSEDDQGSYGPGSSDTDSDAPQQTYNTRAGMLLAKRPSIVREDRQREEDEDDTPGRTKAAEGLTKLDTGPAATRQISPSPLPRTVGGRGHGKGQAGASAAFAQGRTSGRSASQPPLSPTESPTAEGVGLVSRDSIRGGRVHSVSPVRTAHFATTPDSLLVKHQPPARSISPRKSALKHSNSPRGPSPVEGLVTEPNGSEASGSVAGSEELAVPKKKANRVSFDETNVVVGQAATPVSTDSPVVLSPQNKRPWYSIGRGKKKETVVSDEDDEIMKPRPALPSFGSVRERKPSKEVEERQLVKPAEPAEEKLPPASPPIFTSPTGEAIEYPLGQSNDHVVGAILAQDATSKNAANISKSREPLPPEVTSVEGSGYHSDTDSSVYSLDNTESDVGVSRANSVKRGPDDGHVDTYRALANNEEAHVDEHTNGKSATDDLDEDESPTPKANDIVPEIAILEATPTMDESIAKKNWPDMPHMPGAWGSSNSDSDNNAQDDIQVIEPLAAKLMPATEPTPAAVGIAEPSPVVPTPIAPQVAESSAPANLTLAILEEPEESDVSVYSDAAEELTDTEGDGFMSLNAVVESPTINTNIPGLAITTPPDSPITKLTKEKAYKKNQLSRRDSEPEINAGWDKVQEYWSTLSADKKRQLEMEAREEDEDSDSTVEAKPAPKPRKKKVAVQPEPIIVPAQRQPAQNERNYMIQPGAKAGPNGNPPMRSSMRPEPARNPNEPQIRKSMRGPGAMRGSLRGSTETVEPRGSLQKKHRPMSYPPPEAKAGAVAVNGHVRNLSEASAAAAPAAARRDIAPKPALRRKGSGDSDSSFKRARPSNNEIPSFRRSMRASSDQEYGGRNSSPRRSSRFSLRSLSPTETSFRRPFNSGAPPVSSTPTHMRNSLRSSVHDAPTLRNNNSRGFGRQGPSKPSKQKSRVSKSRFADSSDEDEDRPAFLSRFDSSDEEEPAPMPLPSTLRTNAPARGTPKRTKHEDDYSSDLPDSDEEKPGSSALNLGKKYGQNGTVAVSNQGGTLASGSLRRSGSGRGTISSPTTATAPARPNQSRRGSFMSILRRKKPDPASKVRKSDAESPARRDTPLERSKSDLAQLRADRPSTPKLQKRRTMSRENSSSWPLPVPAAPRVAGGDDDRPFSADNANGVVGGEKVNGNGVNGDGRPDLGARRFTATGLADVDISGITNIPGRKKKKFGKLRRMFRLDD
ncbi:hypothetical protein EG329_000189 [Mollisiaceae sp. DMI_Dod_QoI]|nr:hypothetical protein EG329_000189 [Helotiales sp. DMI_Dod_QoI]